MYAIGPPVTGIFDDRFAKLSAINREPIDVIIQATIEVVGFEILAKEAGDMNIPEPMQLPTTMAMAAPNPSSRLNLDSPGSFKRLLLSIKTLPSFKFDILLYVKKYIGIIIQQNKVK